jgi:hypothetical protein
MPEIEENRLYTINEAAEILRISLSTIRRRLTSDPPGLGHIFDGTYRIPGKSITEYLAGHYYQADVEGRE